MSQNDLDLSHSASVRLGKVVRFLDRAKLTSPEVYVSCFDAQNQRIYARLHARVEESPAAAAKVNSFKGDKVRVERVRGRWPVTVARAAEAEVMG